MNEEELERLAAEELLREAKQGAARAVVHGALGWKKESVPKPNKRFLSTTLANTMQYNYRRPRSRSLSPHHKHKLRSKSRGISHHSSYHNRGHRKVKEDFHKREHTHNKERSGKFEDKPSARKEHSSKESDRRSKGHRTTKRKKSN